MTIYDPSRLEIAITRISNLVLRRYYRKFVEVLDLRENDKVIDFGSGTGFLAKQMRRKLTGEESWISCVEISEKWNDVARKNLRKFKKADYYTGMITDLDMKENHYDKIIIHVVIHDIDKEKREAVVKALAKRLKKKGQIIIREPTRSSHGMPIEEIRDYMKKAKMVEISGDVVERKFLGPTFHGVFEKK
ncbi:MAG: methyltransferase domain-containing protein [Asgard group archaeon]|nr:methyltransferase domain-containing protein [Asgard group archaeon]